MTRADIRHAAQGRLLQIASGRVPLGQVYAAVDTAVHKLMPDSAGAFEPGTVLGADGKAAGQRFVPRTQWEPETVAEVVREVRRALRI